MHSRRAKWSIAVLAFVALMTISAGLRAQPALPAPIDPAEEKDAVVKFHLTEAKDFFEMGYYDDCAKQWNTVTDLKPSPALCLELRREFGMDLFAQMLENDKLREPVTAFLKLAREEEERLRQDPVYIKSLVRSLQKTATEREFATWELRKVGERAVPYLLADMLGAANSTQLLNQRMALMAMGKGAVAPLVEALMVKDPVVRESLVPILGSSGDVRALAPLRALLEDPEQPLGVRYAARASLEGIAEGASERSAAQYYFELGSFYYYKNPAVQPWYFEDTVPLWHWDAKEQRIVSASVSRQGYYLELCKRACYDGLKLAPDDVNLRELLISTYFAEKELEGVEADPELAQKIEVLLKSGGKAVLLASLNRQLVDRRPELALDVIKVLRSVCVGEGLTEGERTASGNPLLQALTYPDLAVDFYAAEAIATAAPGKPFDYQDTVVRYLVHGLLCGSGVKTAVVAIPEPERQNRFKGDLQALGYKVAVAASAGEALQLLDALPMPMLVLGNEAIMGEVVPAIASRPYAHLVTRITVSPDVGSFEVKEGQTEVAVPPTITEGQLGEVAAQLAEATVGVKIDATVVARMAAKALVKASRGGTELNVAPASEALEMVMKSKDAEVRIPVLEALGNTRDPGALSPLLAMATDPAWDEQTRLAALDAAKVVLGAMNVAQEDFYNTLVGLLDDESQAVRQAAAACLSAGPFSAEQIVAVLAEKKVLTSVK